MKSLPIYGLRVQEVFQKPGNISEWSITNRGQSRLSLYGDNVLSEHKSNQNGKNSYPGTTSIYRSNVAGRLDQSLGNGI